jgi:putative ABC transport system permease protein
MFRVALSFIRYDKAKSIGALFGIIISTFLIGQQTGIFTFLVNAMGSLVDNSRADIWVVDSRTTNANALAPLDVRKIREVASIPGVAKVHPVVIAGGSARFPDGRSAAVQVIGSDAPYFKMGPPDKLLFEGDYSDLIPDGAVSSDVYDSPALANSTRGTVFELNGKRSYIAVRSKGVRGFGAVVMYTTLERARFYGNYSLNNVSAILVEVEPGTPLQTVRDRINQTLFGIRAWTREEFASQTKITVLATTGIAISIGTLLIFAVLSGTIIIGLTLYSAALDRIRDYGTLKAIGASNGYITRLILLQALIFALMGFAVGYTLVEGFRAGVSNAGTIFSFSWPIRIVFFVVTCSICFIGAVFAIRRINSVEPAMVFRG